MQAGLLALDLACVTREEALALERHTQLRIRLHEHALQHLEPGPYRDTSAFEYGLDLLLDSLERLR